MAMENGPFLSDFPIKASIPRGFSIAMFDYQRVIQISYYKSQQITMVSIDYIPISHDSQLIKTSVHSPLQAD